MNEIPQQATEAAIMKAASAVQVVGSVVAGASGGGLVLGLTTAQWSVVGIIGGLSIAAVAAVVKACTDWYFQSQHLKLAERAARGER